MLRETLSTQQKLKTKTIGVAKATPQLKGKMIKENKKLKNTLELIKLMHETLTEVIQFLDEKKYSNTKVREKVDMILNHSKLANKVEKEMEKIIWN